MPSGDNGQAVAPTSPEEMLEQARIVKETTGNYYIVTESGASNVMPVRIFLAWLWQQGSDIVDAEGNVTLQTPKPSRLPSCSRTSMPKATSTARTTCRAHSRLSSTASRQGLSKSKAPQ